MKQSKENIPIIEFENVSMKYKKKLNNSLDDISFKLKEGDFHAFLGSNGAGKSTTIRILIGLNRDYSGSVKYYDSNLMQFKEPIRNMISYVPAHIVFPNDFKVYSYLLNNTLLVRNDIEEIKKEIDHYLKTFNLTKYKNKITNKLSSGERQKIALVRAMLENSKILVLDEPFSNLDPKSRYQWMNFLKTLNEKNNTTIFLSSHVISDLVGFVNSATFIENGKILYNGKIKSEELKEKYMQYIIKNDELINYEI